MSTCEHCGKPCETPRREDRVWGTFCDECLKENVGNIGQSVRRVFYTSGTQPESQKEDKLSFFPQQPAPAVQEQYTGILTGMEPRAGGWFKFSIHQEGRQWPVKVDTKLPQLIQAAQSLMGQPVMATASVSQSQNINPNSGQPYMNRTLQSIQPAAGGGATFQGAQQAGTGAGPQTYGQPQTPQVPVQGQSFVDPVSKDWRIMRQTATKVAAHFLPHLEPELRTVDTIIGISDQLLHYYVYGRPAGDNPGHGDPGVGGGDPSDDVPFGTEGGPDDGIPY